MASIDSVLLTEQLQAVYDGVLTCDFCPQMFGSALERNSHILQHFVQEFCPRCNKHLIRIGENLYVLHTSITCIKSESQPEPFDVNHSHLPIEFTQTADALFKDDCDKADFVNETISFSDFNDVQNKFEVFEVQINPSELMEVTAQNLLNTQQVTVTNQTIVSTTTAMATATATTTEPSPNDGHLNYTEALTQMNAIQDTNDDDNDESNIVKKAKSKKPTTEYNSQVVKCEIEGCDKVMSRNALTYHLSKHRGDRYDCDICQASLSSKSGIRSHLLTHIQKDERLKCETCELTYATKSGLRKHQKFVHSNEAKRFICTICGEGLRQPYLLKEHMFKHTGQRPFKCAYCEKSFRTKRLRSEHERIHTGEKPYRCMIDDCDRAFAYIIDLKRHKYTVHGIYTRQFTCHICSKIFSENMLLRKHMKSHNRIVQKKIKKFTRTKKTKT